MKNKSEKDAWFVSFDKTLDPRGSLMIIRKTAKGHITSDVTEITVDNPEFPIYMEILGEFKNDEVKKIASLDELKMKVVSMKKQKNLAKPPLPESIGTATMKEDGTLYMQLRSEDHGMIAEALKIVKKNDAEYKKMVDHLGGIKPGQAKSIPPFDD